jgi:hypothetical protein
MEVAISFLIEWWADVLADPRARRRQQGARREARLLHPRR